MLVTVHNFDKVMDVLASVNELSFDTETTGLYPFHGDIFFSVAIATKDNEYYFNWNTYDDMNYDFLLQEKHKSMMLKRLFWGTENRHRHWFMHNAKYDLTMSRMTCGWAFSGDIWCTQAQARVEFNELLKGDFSLEVLGDKIGYKKDPAVEDYIKKHNLYTVRMINDHTFKQPRYDLVPFEMISSYAMQDARVTYQLGKHQIASITLQDAKTPQNLPKLSSVAENEMKLTKALFEMEYVGARANLDYCTEATAHEKFVMDKAISEFEEITGREFKKSNKLFQELFFEEKHKWGTTKKGGYSIDAKVLKTLDHPAARAIVRYTEAKNKIDFYQGFIKHADPNGDIHTSFNSYGARTGRFSSSNPNLQNMKKDDEDTLQTDDKYVVRRAIVPRDGYFFAMMDYDQIEYRMMLDVAGAHSLIDKVLGGLDVHQATADLAYVTRRQAKTVNFLTLYGGGIKKLAMDLGVSVEEAKRIQGAIFSAAPEIKKYMNQVKYAAERRKWIFNWLGRIYRFDSPRFCYKAPNTHIQGGAADVLKVAIVRIHDLLKDYKSRMVLNIHDELVFEIAFGEESVLEQIKEIMQGVYPYKRLPLTVGIDYSFKSLADKSPWDPIQFEHGKKTRDNIQGQNTTQTEGPAELLGREDSASGNTRYA